MCQRALDESECDYQEDVIYVWNDKYAKYLI